MLIVTNRYVGLTAIHSIRFPLNPALVLWSLGRNQGNQRFRKVLPLRGQYPVEHQADLSLLCQSGGSLRRQSQPYGLGRTADPWLCRLVHHSQQSAVPGGIICSLLAGWKLLGSRTVLPLIFHGGRYAAMRPDGFATHRIEDGGGPRCVIEQSG